MKSLAGELTENERWSIKGKEMGECWHKDCCISEHKEIAIFKTGVTL